MTDQQPSMMGGPGGFAYGGATSSTPVPQRFSSGALPSPTPSACAPQIPAALHALQYFIDESIEDMDQAAAAQQGAGGFLDGGQKRGSLFPGRPATSSASCLLPMTSPETQVYASWHLLWFAEHTDVEANRVLAEVDAEAHLYSSEADYLKLAFAKSRSYRNFVAILRWLRWLYKFQTENEEQALRDAASDGDIEMRTSKMEPGMD
ncbi:unnamed protein product, partial [Amoebophrya sp. A25]|eukprot:GSA25T00003803001.1